jgi:hypothetical protein
LVFSFLFHFLLLLVLVPGLVALTQYKITPVDGAVGDAFGEAVDTDGLRVIVGAPEKDNTTGQLISSNGMVINMLSLLS